jgi:preprotein translocase subunit SecA
LVVILIALLTLWVGKRTLDATHQAPSPPSDAEIAKIVRGVMEQNPAPPSPSATHTKPAHEKLGRNDPCWCGSDKKFKRCHGP